MKTLLLTLMVLIFSGCATSGNKSGDNEVPLVIELPPTPKEQIVRSPFFNTQKSSIKQPNGFEYEFYYGSGGRYIVVVKPPAGVFLDFAQAEATLLVAGGSDSPEIISLSVDRKGIFMGSGEPRNGLTKFNLHVFVPASRYNSSLDDSLDFKISINNQF